MRLDVSFSHFADLLHQISSLPPGRFPSRVDSRRDPCHVLSRWIDALLRPVHPRIGPILFRLLFPEEDSSRRYGLQESKLARGLAIALVLPPRDLESLLDWSRSSGCLGSQMFNVMHPQASRTEFISLLQVDDLLTELASLSLYTDPRMKIKSCRVFTDILKDLFENLSPWEGACMTQIILRDLRPLLYPPPSLSPTFALLHYTGAAYRQITPYDAMKAWDFRMPRIHARCSRLDEAAATLRDLQDGVVLFDDLKSRLGTPISIPRCHKGTSCHQVMEKLHMENDEVFGEIKYDGERMQIHFDSSLATDKQIKIFSKSRKESTLDRFACHSIIRAALGTSEISTANDTTTTKQIPPEAKSVILEAEMVAYSEERCCIDEFWRIRSLVEATSRGARARMRHRHGTHHSTQLSMISDASAEGERHLMCVFFDVLQYNGKDLLDKSYCERRTLLERIISPTPGFAMVAERTCVKEPGTAFLDSVARLRNCFAKCVSVHEEGLVIKASSSLYNDYNLPWIKLKRDYIPGFGDNVDLVCFAAKWSKDRGRELGVGPEVLTDFYVGTVGGTPQPINTRPRFEGVFVVAYGLSRAELEDLNYRVKHIHRAMPFSMAKSTLPYELELHANVPQPEMIWKEPFLVEVFGAGFTKSRGAKRYELRFPRLSKIFQDEERSWQDAMSTNDFHAVALNAIGRNSSVKETSDEVKRIWGRIPSPGNTSLGKRKAVEKLWKSLLEQADQRGGTGVSFTRIRNYQSIDCTPSRAHRTSVQRTSRDAIRDSFVPSCSPSTSRVPIHAPASVVAECHGEPTAIHPFDHKGEQPLLSEVGKSSEEPPVYHSAGFSELDFHSALVFMPYNQAVVNSEPFRSLVQRRVSTLDAFFSALGWLGQSAIMAKGLPRREFAIGIAFLPSNEVSKFVEEAQVIFRHTISHECVKPLYLISI